jgi:predicted outer membrane repeat protein
VINCTFSENTADANGGAINNEGSTPTLTNCTFALNSATNGQALAFDSLNQKSPSDFTMTNCIVWNSGDSIWNNDGSTITIQYSDVAGGWPGIGNINADPLFVDPLDADFRLSPGSPGIDAGDNSAIVDLADTDLDGNPRFVDDPYIVDTGSGNPPIVDMGAYELCLWDCGGDHDGNVGIVDFLALLAQWDRVGTTCDFGLGDPGVGVNEFLDVLANWGLCP